MLGKKVKDKLCPMLKKPCIGVDCMWWVQIRGNHPQTGDPVDEGDCAIAWQPFLMIENSNQQRSTGAAVESFRNEMVQSNEVYRQMLITTDRNNEDFR